MFAFYLQKICSKLANTEILNCSYVQTVKTRHILKMFDDHFVDKFSHLLVYFFNNFYFVRFYDLQTKLS